jgi:hypothetical protein
LNDVISPGLTVPSGSRLSHRSHTVVAPRVTGYSQDGHSRCRSSRYASSVAPARVSASQITGVPAKPVAMWWPSAATSSARRRPAARASAGGSRSKTSASAYAVWLSLVSRPSAVTWAALKRSRAPAAAVR